MESLLHSVVRRMQTRADRRRASERFRCSAPAKSDPRQPGKGSSSSWTRSDGKFTVSRRLAGCGFVIYSEKSSNNAARRWLQPRSDYDATAFRPRYDFSTTYVVTVDLSVRGLLHYSLNKLCRKPPRYAPPPAS